MPESIILDIDPVGLAVGAQLAQARGIWGIKVGDLIEQQGAHEVMRELDDPRVMVDLKLFDTKDRVARRLKFYRDLPCPPEFITVSGLLPQETLTEAVRVAQPRVGVIVVTVLSDWEKELCVQELPFFEGDPLKALLARAVQNAKAVGAQGITCPAHLLLAVEPMLQGSNLDIIATGVRSAGKKTHNHIDPRPPEEALKLGADYVVIGREVTDSPNPLKAIGDIVERCS